MLHSLDETLNHQIPATFGHVGTSDHRFFDRNWFGMYEPGGSVGVITGLGAYPNMNVLDGFAAVQRGGRQHNVRASRCLRPSIEGLAVGPIHHEVLEPLRTHRLVLEPSAERSVSFDLVWDGAFPAHEEPLHLNSLDGRVYEEYIRFDQVGRVSGEVTVDGERIEATDWFGVRDHSWGVRRSVGGFEPFTGSFPPELHGMLFVWLEFAAGDHWGHVQLHEDGVGRRRLLEGFVAGPAGQFAVLDVDHEITFIPGTRAYSRAVLDLTVEGGTHHRIEGEPLMTAWAYKGTGYDSGFGDGRGLGVYRGTELVEHDVYGVSDPEQVLLPDGTTIRPVHREQPVRMTFDGAPGFGHFPIMPIARIERYGLVL